MAVHYEVPAGKVAVIDGPANIIVNTGGVPIIGTGVVKMSEPAPEDDVETAAGRRKRS